jgi:hypothetical protein
MIDTLFEQVAYLNKNKNVDITLSTTVSKSAKKLVLKIRHYEYMKGKVYYKEGSGDAVNIVEDLSEESVKKVSKMLARLYNN